jgi:tripartite-type tricarboxylate transporter receptor subunit TctC
MLEKLRWALVAALLAASGAAFAQAGAPIRIVIAFPPGGPVDFVARILAEGLGKELNTTVIVENKPGGNGAVSAQAVIAARPDGNTLWLSSAGAAAINPPLYQNLSYKMSDLAPVSQVVDNVEVLVTQPANPAKSVPDLVAQSKQKKEPTPIASSGIGSMPHLAMELLVINTNANLLHVPYKGAAPAITGRDGRAGGGLLRRHSRPHRQRQGRQVEAARHRGGQAQRRDARRADARRARHQGRGGEQLVRVVRAREDAAAADRRNQRRGA